MMLLLACVPLAAAHPPALQNEPGAQTAAPAAPNPEEPKPETNPNTSAPAPAVPSTEQPASPSSSQPAASTTPAPKHKPTATKAAKASSSKTPAKKHVRRRTTGQPQAPKKVVVRNGGASDAQGQISSGSGTQQANQQRTNLDSILAATNGNLKTLSGRQLSQDQQDMVNQIKRYMEQSKSAAAAGDLQGANNLALKARLLSEELIKH
jgi:outer membrane biosynthesis protein TonB